MQSEILLASYNIRFDNPADGKNAWEFRKDSVLSIIKSYDFDIVGLQEVTPSQYSFFEQQDNFAVIGGYRDIENGKGTEASAILYKKDTFDCTENGTFWLSNTPDIISRYEDADCIRICTWGKFTHKASGKEFIHLNTHLDHISEAARVFGAQKIVEFAEQTFPKETVLFLTGDFNENEQGKWFSVFQNAGFNDSRVISQKPYKGPYGTNTGVIFEENVPIKDYWRIDFIFSNHHNVEEAHTIVYDSPSLPSDHLPIYAKIKL